jgi:hypothetical protein
MACQRPYSSKMSIISCVETRPERVEIRSKYREILGLTGRLFATCAGHIGLDKCKNPRGENAKLQWPGAVSAPSLWHNRRHRGARARSEQLGTRLALIGGRRSPRGERPYRCVRMMMRRSRSGVFLVFVKDLDAAIWRGQGGTALALHARGKLAGRAGGIRPSPRRHMRHILPPRRGSCEGRGQSCGTSLRLSDGYSEFMDNLAKVAVLPPIKEFLGRTEQVGCGKTQAQVLVVPNRD